MNFKRITLLSGHYGSGKTNIAVNMAYDLKRQKDRVAIADLDIVNPYFRTKDSAGELEAAGIRLICSDYANTNLDIPALPQDMYTIIDDRELYSIIDVGGDDRGALALGRISKMISDEGNYDMYLVVNRFRPLTPDAASTVSVMHEIENAGAPPFTGIINNSNLGAETGAEDILSGIGYAEEISRISGLPVAAVTVKEDLYEELKGKIDNLYPLRLQEKIYDYFKRR